ncbi:LacI family DNA-binding transcriptional regulator [Microbacterium sp. 3J1]|uniref:LacI family DNA-binding transcriptional regulator n=1 Tax=Microbacterium sp. 3J1 TaxID=861269 RepID=UPI000A5B5E47|nr:LacI family DNA-binding transcriptional regulator [Microbacterium sp. 3J1]
MSIPKRPTLADVAELSGMSKTAVSLILNDRPGSRLSQEAAERIRVAAAELGYKPNPAAQSLRLGKTRSIGFISNEVTITRYASAMTRGVLAGAKRWDHTVLMAETGSDVADLRLAIEQMLDRRVDGIVIGLMGARLVDAPALPDGLPAVIVNGRTTTGLPSILPDEHQAGRTVAQTIIDAGHRSIGVIGTLQEIASDPRQSVTIGARFDGLREGFAAAGVEPLWREVPAWSPAVGYDEVERLRREHPEITAVVAGNDNVAFGVYQALAERGVRVPDEISVISFDDEELAGYLRPGLTTSRLPYQEMAEIAVDMILGDRRLKDALVTMPLTRRESVGKPAQRSR